MIKDYRQRVKAAWLILRGKSVVFRVEGSMTLRASAIMFPPLGGKRIQVVTIGGGGAGGVR